MTDGPIIMNFIWKGTLYPHILDATGKSIQWIMTHFKSMTVETTSQRDERFANILDLAIRFWII